MRRAAPGTGTGTGTGTAPLRRMVGWAVGGLSPAPHRAPLLRETSRRGSGAGAAGPCAPRVQVGSAPRGGGELRRVRQPASASGCRSPGGGGKERRTRVGSARLKPLVRSSETRLPAGSPRRAPGRAARRAAAVGVCFPPRRPFAPRGSAANFLHRLRARLPGLRGV